MGKPNGLDNRLDQLGGCIRWQRPKREFVLQTLSLDEAHRKEMPTIDFADFVNWNNVRVVDSNNGPELASESFQLHSRALDAFEVQTL